MSGKGVKEYLQGQLTQNVLHLNTGQAIYACLLTPQGKAVSELYLFEHHDASLLIIVPKEAVESTVARLHRYALGYELRIDIMDTWILYSVQGVQAAQAIGECFSLATPQTSARLSCSYNDGFIAMTVSEEPLGYWVVAEHQIDIPPEKQFTSQDIEALRIYRGFPRFATDWDASIYPLNANLIDFDGVSFDKGCYVGQEVTSRMRWRGGIKKKFFRVAIEGELSDMPQTILSSAKIGVLSSATHTPDGLFGIAHLPIDSEQADKKLTLESGASIRVIEPCHG